MKTIEQEAIIELLDAKVALLESRIKTLEARNMAIIERVKAADSYARLTGSRVVAERLDAILGIYSQT